MDTKKSMKEVIYLLLSQLDDEDKLKTTYGQREEIVESLHDNCDYFDKITESTKDFIEGFAENYPILDKFVCGEKIK